MARRRGQFEKKIRFTHWTGFVGSALAMSAGTVGATLFAAAHEPETILRLRGNVLGIMDGAQANGTGARVGIGIIPVPEGTGTTVLWSPLTDADAPWLWYTTFALAYEEMVVDGVQASGASGYRETIDNKAMRIIRNQELQVVFEQITFGAATDVNLVLEGRSLSGAG